MNAEEWQQLMDYIKAGAAHPGGRFDPPIRLVDFRGEKWRVDYHRRGLVYFCRGNRKQKMPFEQFKITAAGIKLRIDLDGVAAFVQGLGGFGRYDNN